MQRSLLRSLIISGIALFATTGIVVASNVFDITGKLGGKTGDFFDINGTLLVDSIKVGAQGVGGVTYFNGSIANATTNVNNIDNPVTVGDNLRVDGTIFRGKTEGPGDGQEVKLNDDVRVFGNLTVDSGRTMTVTGVNFTGLASDDLSDVANLGRLDEAETITGNWVNTANPWAANEIADVTRSVELPLTSFLSDADGTTAITPVTNSTVPKLVYTANRGLALQYARTETTDAGTQFTVPTDYVSGGVVKAVVDMSGAIVTDWDLDFQMGISHTAGTAAWATSMANETVTNLPDSPGTPKIVTLTPTNQSSIQAGDTIFLDLFPANNSGVGEPNLNISNVWFEYTASQ